MSSSIGLGVIFAAGIALRLALFRTDVASWFTSRVEISNALTSWQKGVNSF